MGILLAILFFGLLWGVVCVLIAQRKNNPTGGAFCWGFFLGLIGVLIVAMSRPGPPPALPGLMATKCPRCNAAQNIPAQATTFECWQCHLVTAASTPPAGAAKRIRVTCPQCKTRLNVPAVATKTHFTCRECGADGQMPLLA
jgi:predicted RNA-binding Zn-ribbon protein involved in translation (DUF1610 family)